jgi:hypothetical protein
MGSFSLSVIISLSTLLWSKDMAEILVFKRRLVGLVNSERTCRGGSPNKTLDGRSFADFMKRTLASELKITGCMH